MNRKYVDTEGTESLPGTPIVIKVSYRPSPEYPSDYEQDLVKTTSPSVVNQPIIEHESVNEGDLSPLGQETNDMFDLESDPIGQMDPLTVP